MSTTCGRRHYDRGGVHEGFMFFGQDVAMTRSALIPIFARSAVLASTLLGVMGVRAEPEAAAVCGGPYSLMLVTEAECRAHVAQLHRLEARGDTEALARARREHALLLEERAHACRCVLPEGEAAPVVTASDC